MHLTLMSFGYKRDLPPDAEIVFDVRFLKNPHYDPALQPFSGLDKSVGEHIESDPDFADFYAKLTALLTLMLQRHRDKERQTMTIAIGCTGGKHRSVYMVQKLGGFLEKEGYKVTLNHRDLEKEKI